jgi:hypothetical protein
MIGLVRRDEDTQLVEGRAPAELGTVTLKGNSGGGLGQAALVVSAPVAIIVPLNNAIIIPDTICITMAVARKYTKGRESK